jgi:hypothetical protein
MQRDAFEELQAQNPVPELLPGLPVDVIRRYLESEPPIPAARPRSRRALRFGPFLCSFALTCIVGAIVVIAGDSLPAGSPAGFSVADAVAAVRQGQQKVSTGSGAFLYTEYVQTASDPGGGTSRSTGRSWEPEHGTLKGSWRISNSGILATDVASVGGIFEYYIPSKNTIYLNRPKIQASISGEDIDPETPDEEAIHAMINVQSSGSSGSGSITDVIRHMLAMPGARVTHSGGLLSVTVRRGDHVSTIVAHLGSYQPVLIRSAAPGPLDGEHPDYTTTLRVIAYNKRIPAAVAAKQLNLMLAHPHAKLVTIHQDNLQLPAFGPPRSYPTSIGALVGGLETLARPQAPTDLSYFHAGQNHDPSLVRGLVRLAATARFPTIGEVRIYLVVGRTSPTRRIGLADPGWAQAQAIGPGNSGTQSPRSYPNRYEPREVTVRPLTSPGGTASDRELALSIVDSGVTRVAWTFAAGDGSSRKIVIHASVINNVAFALVKRPLGRLVHAAWSGPNFYPPRPRHHQHG